MDEVFKINTKPVRMMNLSALAEQCIYRLPGCSDLMLRMEMQKTIVEVCEMTPAMVFPVTFEVQPLVTKYYIPIAIEFVACHIDSVETNHPGESRISPDDIIVKWDPVPHIVLKRAFTKEELNIIENGEKREPFEITVNVCATPTLGCDDYPESFLRRWQSTIIAGTLARLLMMTGKAWSDPTCAAIEANSYQNGLNDIAVRRLTNGIKRHSSINKNNAYKSHWFI